MKVFLSLHLMRKCLYILFLLCPCFALLAQTPLQEERGGASLQNLSQPSQNIPDSLLHAHHHDEDSARIKAFHLTDKLGDIYRAPRDTNRLNTANSTLVEGRSLAVGYLGNLGSPAQSKMFFDRKEPRDFMFADAFDFYTTTPQNAYWYDTKIPYSEILYTRAGSKPEMEEDLKILLTTNFGKKLNIGGEMDYIYGRGHYNSNNAKLLTYRLFGSYRTDRYELNTYFSNYNYVVNENGGLTNDEQITKPEKYEDEYGSIEPKGMTTRFTNTWNRVRGKQFFLNHRYNLGFTRTLDEVDEEGFQLEEFVPVSSIIHTLEYEDNRRRFISSTDIDTMYQNVYAPEKLINENVNDEFFAWNMKNTIALSLREGFQDWVKMGLTAFITFENRNFKMPNGELTGRTDTVNAVYHEFTEDTLHTKSYSEFTTYIGAELSKQQGSLLTYRARGEFGLAGDDLAEFRVSGELQTKFKLFKKDATIKAMAHLNNLTPAFFYRHYHNRFYWWDNDFKNTQRFFVGGEINLASTRTQLKAGVESIQNFVYFDGNGLPAQYESNLQVVEARIKQDFRVGILGWENEVALQLSSNDEVLPLPQLTAYSNLYITFKYAKVLNFQIGADVHYHTAYYAPYYEPATQQFQVQDPATRVKYGNYPLVNAYMNCHLKQARFFVTFYNLSQKFAKPDYLSLAHYPLNQMVMKLGISVYFNQ